MTMSQASKGELSSHIGRDVTSERNPFPNVAYNKS